MLFYDMLDNGQSQPTAGNRLGSAGISAVKPLKYAFLLIFRNADARIADDKQDPVFFRADSHIHMTAGPVIFYGIIDEIKDNFTQEAQFSPNRHFFQCTMDSDLFFMKDRFHKSYDILHNAFQIDRLAFLYFPPLLNTG